MYVRVRVCTDAMGGPQSGMQQHRYPQQSAHMMQQQQKAQMSQNSANVVPPGGMMGVNGSQVMSRGPSSGAFVTRLPMQGRQC